MQKFIEFLYTSPADTIWISDANYYLDPLIGNECKEYSMHRL